jgi:hypothetical protein
MKSTLLTTARLIEGEERINLPDGSSSSGDQNYSFRFGTRLRLGEKLQRGERSTTWRQDQSKHGQMHNQNPKEMYMNQIVPKSLCNSDAKE